MLLHLFYRNSVDFSTFGPVGDPESGSDLNRPAAPERRSCSRRVPDGTGETPDRLRRDGFVVAHQGRGGNAAAGSLGPPADGSLPLSPSIDAVPGAGASLARISGNCHLLKGRE